MLFAISGCEIKDLQACYTLHTEFCSCSCGLLNRSINCGGLGPFTSIISPVTYLYSEKEDLYLVCASILDIVNKTWKEVLTS